MELRNSDRWRQLDKNPIPCGQLDGYPEISQREDHNRTNSDYKSFPSASFQTAGHIAYERTTGLFSFKFVLMIEIHARICTCGTCEKVAEKHENKSLLCVDFA